MPPIFLNLINTISLQIQAVQQIPGRIKKNHDKTCYNQIAKKKTKKTKKVIKRKILKVARKKGI